VTATLKRVSVDGGQVSTVVSGVRRGRWDVADSGIVFLTGAPGLAPDPATPDALEFFSFNDGRTRRLGELPFPVISRGYSPPRVLTVSPDARWALVSHMDHWERDIVVADNFRWDCAILSDHYISQAQGQYGRSAMTNVTSSSNPPPVHCFSSLKAASASCSADVCSMSASQRATRSPSKNRPARSRASRTPSE
jgi:hypothetical protein